MHSSIQAFISNLQILRTMSPRDPRVLSGVDRGGFHPILAAGAAWLNATGNVLDDELVDALLSRAFPTNIVIGYTRRFADFAPKFGPLPKDAPIESGQFVQEAILESDAWLRKILVLSRPEAVFHDDEDFDTDPTYARALASLEELRPLVLELSTRELSRCPRCALVGDLHGWFGIRSMQRKTIRQSWCRVCRSIGPKSGP